MYRIFVVQIVILFILTGCGGGGSSVENGNGGTQNIKPTSISRPTPTAGDFVTYQRIAELRRGSAPSYTYVPYGEFTTNRVVFVNADSSYKQTETSHSYYLTPNSLSERIQNTKAQAFFSSDHGLSAFYNFKDQYECRYTPPFRTEPNLLTVGLIWSIETKASCSDDGIPDSFTTTYQGKVLGLDTITVPAGTFNTLKYEITLKSANIESNPSAIVNCWKDTVTGLDVRCDRLPSASFPRVSSNELVGYSIAGLGKKIPLLLAMLEIGQVNILAMIKEIAS